MPVSVLVLGSVALLLFLFLLGALALVRRVETSHEQAHGLSSSERPQHAGSSGDVHVVLGFASPDEPAAARLREASAACARGATDEALSSLCEALAGAEARATHGLLTFGHFRVIAVRSAAASTTYVHLRLRQPVDVVRVTDRATLGDLVTALRVRAGAAVVSVDARVVTPTTDPAALALVPLDPSGAEG